jgi:LPS-assembly protein
VRISGKSPGLIPALLFIWAGLSLVSSGARGAEPASGRDGPMHWSARKQVFDRRNQVVSLTGNAILSQEGERMLADSMRIDLKARTVSAQGNCIYLSRDIVMHSQFMSFNLDTRTGTLLGGRIAGEGFALSGEKISRLGEGRFSALNAEYTTCKDCPQSWSFLGEEVDLTFGGYGWMKNVRGKVGGVPLAWFPYLVFPLKTERQTGVLAPRLRFSGADGFAFVQPFFWAISRSSDMTLGVGNYSARGPRLEWEGRTMFLRGSAQANFIYQRDRTYSPFNIDFDTGDRTALGEKPNRWALLVGQRQEFLNGWTQTLRIEEVSDANYPSDLGDLLGRREAVVTSSFAVTRTSPWSSSVLSLRRFRNRIGPDPLAWDGQVVQPLPSLTFTSNERPWLPGLYGGISTGFSRFAREQGAFEADAIGEILGSAPVGLRAGAEPEFGRDPIRQATRLTVTPSIYSDWTPVDGVSIIPSAQYRAAFYDFDEGSTEVGSLSRGYLLTQLEASTELGRTFSGQGGGASYRHTIRPTLTYSLIPLIRDEEGHPFVRQMAYAQEQGFSGYNFDNLDIIPLDTSRAYNNYFLPLGNSLSMGLVSQLYRRSEGGEVTRQVEFTANQSVNFREFALNPSERQPFSRLASSLSSDIDRFSLRVFYFYYPYANPEPPSNRNKVTATLSYIHERSVRQRVLDFERSATLGYRYDRLDGINRIKNLTASVKFSLTDSIQPFGGVDYNLPLSADAEGTFQRVNAGVNFQSISQCWKTSLRLSQTLERPGTNLDFEFGLNLGGTGFGSTGLPGGD